MQVADVEMVRSVRREMSRHAFDPAEVSVHVSHGIVHLVGRVRPCRGHEHDFVEEIHSFERALRQRPGVRDVMPEWTADGYNLGSTSTTRSR